MSAKQTRKGWVVYERQVELSEQARFVFLSPFFKTREKAEKVRERMTGQPEYKRRSLGITFVR